MKKTTLTTVNRVAAIAALPIKPLLLGALLVGALALGLSPVYGAEPEGAAVATTVNINKADAQTLAAVLVGVGVSRAEDIIRYREQYGPFTTVEQLAEVKGIGNSTLEKNRAAITLD